VRGNFRREGSSGRAPTGNRRGRKQIAATAALIACALAGVLSLGVSSDATATTPALFHDDFESGGLSNWTASSGLVAQEAHVFRGSWAAEATATGGGIP